MNVYPSKHGFVWKLQTLIPLNINEFTVYSLQSISIAQTIADPLAFKTQQFRLLEHNKIFIHRW